MAGISMLPNSRQEMLKHGARQVKHSFTNTYDLMLSVQRLLKLQSYGKRWHAVWYTATYIMEESAAEYGEL
jgi:hypothetical protein